MQDFAKDQLIPGKMYIIYSFGGCQAMETELKRRFIGLNNEGEPVFYSKTMGNIVFREDMWIFYSNTKSDTITHVLK